MSADSTRDRSVLRRLSSGRLVTLHRDRAEAIIAADPDADFLVPWVKSRAEYFEQNLARFLIWLGAPFASTTQEDVTEFLEGLGAHTSGTVAYRYAALLKPLLATFTERPNLAQITVTMPPRNLKKHVTTASLPKNASERIGRLRSALRTIGTIEQMPDGLAADEYPLFLEREVRQKIMVANDALREDDND